MIRIIDASSVPSDEIVKRKEHSQPNVSAAVTEIIYNVRRRGDAALRDYTLRFDGADVAELRVSDEEIERAKKTVDAEFLKVLEAAAENIREYHSRQIREGFTVNRENGVVMGQRVMPLERVGVYIPGGTAAYPSTALMDIIPAKIAGVSEVIMLTPPRADGSVDDGILAAAAIAGADKIYKAGGAQAIAALAYGTESIPRVDKIAGPGNIYVAEAKKQVFGAVGIDMIAGPSDILIIADETANPVFTAADMLGQSEHDENASAVLITVGAELAAKVAGEIERQIADLERKSIAAVSLKNNGMIILVKDLKQAADLSDALAPEHLELCVADPFSLLDDIRNAGSVFLGHYTPEALGDYFAGPNHTLPTMGTARFYSPLSVDDFVKKSSFLYYPKDVLIKAGGMVETFALKEGLTAHAKSVAVRMEEMK